MHGLTPLGSTGEFAYLNWAQRRRVVEVEPEAAAGRVPVVAGVAATATADAVAQARAFDALGCDGILAILEAYFPLKDDAIEGHFRAIAGATERLWCSTPIRISSALICPCPCSRPWPRCQTLPTPEMRPQTPDASSPSWKPRRGSWRFFPARPMPAAVMLLGGVGWMAGPACVAPRESVALYEACRRGAWEDAMALQRPLWRLNQLFARHMLAPCIKAGLAPPGLRLRRPPSAPGAPRAEAQEDVRRTLASLGLL